MNLREKTREAFSAVVHDPFESFRFAALAWNSFYFRRLRRCAGGGSVFGAGVRIVNSANVAIGRNCLMQDGVYMRAGAQGRIQVDDRVAVNSFCQFFGHGGISIGEDTQIGPGTIITTTGHDYRENLEERFSPIVIGRRVWIGANVTIIGGVSIGDGAVIGAGAVVITDVPAHTLAVGVPAKVVRELPAEPGRSDSDRHASGGANAPPLECGREPAASDRERV